MSYGIEDFITPPSRGGGLICIKRPALTLVIISRHLAKLLPRIGTYGLVVAIVAVSMSAGNS